MLIDARYKVNPSVVYNGDLAADTAQATEGLDLQEQVGVAFFVNIPTAGAITLEESDDNATWNTVTAEYVVAENDGDSGVTFIADHVGKIGYEGLKRYVRAVVVAEAAVTGAVVIGVTIPDFDRKYLEVPA